MSEGTAGERGGLVCPEMSCLVSVLLPGQGWHWAHGRSHPPPRPSRRFRVRMQAVCLSRPLLQQLAVASAWSASHWGQSLGADVQLWVRKRFPPVHLETHNPKGWPWKRTRGPEAGHLSASRGQDAFPGSPRCRPPPPPARKAAAREGAQNTPQGKYNECVMKLLRLPGSRGAAAACPPACRVSAQATPALLGLHKRRPFVGGVHGGPELGDTLYLLTNISVCGSEELPREVIREPRSGPRTQS